MKQMLLKMHGVRGSIPTPYADRSRFGGNTSSIEIATPATQIFYDAGTGFAHAEFDPSAQNRLMLFSHFHHDHIQGLGFNPAIYLPDNQLRLCSALVPPERLNAILSDYYQMPYFPVDIFGMSSHLICSDFEQTVAPLADDIRISSIELNHPGGACGYLFETDAAKIAVLLDNEFTSSQHPMLARACEGADLVVWDGTYTQAELADKTGWGHSSIEQALSFSEDADIGHILITHHEPARTDDEITRFQSVYNSHKLSFAYEGMEFNIPASQ